MKSRKPLHKGTPVEPTREISREEVTGLTEATVDVSSLFTEDVSVSGSFDLRRFQLSSLGKLLNIAPIPTLLVDESLRIMFANQACGRLALEDGGLEGGRFGAVFPGDEESLRAEEMVVKVFSQRIPLVVEAILGRQGARILGRVHFRCVRIQGERYVFVMVENITPSKTKVARKFAEGS